MSFGFSIGDIVLLSKLAYDLYSSVSDGRKAASGDLQELESVLFSLRCALDHLGDVSKDVLAKANQSDDGPDFTTKLDKMMTSCKATLQELDDVTKKYRELGIDSEPEATQPGKKKFTYEVAKKKVKVNWTKIRWDQEKRSLQSYREKLKSHTDAIQIIIISTLWFVVPPMYWSRTHRLIGHGSILLRRRVSLTTARRKNCSEICVPIQKQIWPW